MRLVPRPTPVAAADAADLARCQRVIAVVADLGGQVEGDAQPGDPLREEVPVPRVGFLRRGEARVLAHRPRSSPIHRGLDATREGESAGFFVEDVAHGTAPILTDRSRLDS